MDRVAPNGYGNATVFTYTDAWIYGLKPVVDIYGSVEYQFTEFASGYPKKVEVLGVEYDVSEITEYNASQMFSKYGFVEGVARITTPVGSAACVVKNGTLYPIISEYDSEVDDHHTLTDVQTDGDREYYALQKMLDHVPLAFAYDEDSLASLWSPVESYLHAHVDMPIVPKVSWIPPAELGLADPLPGLNYEVSL